MRASPTLAGWLDYDGALSVSQFTGAGGMGISPFIPHELSDLWQVTSLSWVCISLSV